MLHTLPGIWRATKLVRYSSVNTTHYVVSEFWHFIHKFLPQPDIYCGDCLARFDSFSVGSLLASWYMMHIPFKKLVQALPSLGREGACGFGHLCVSGI